MKTDDFDYNLPEELIAQVPLKDRSASRLMVLNRENNTIEDKSFKDIVDMFGPNDVLVFNNSRVIPARLFGVKEGTMAHIEVLLLKNEGDVWETLCKPARRVSVGTIIDFGDGLLKAECISCEEDGMRHFKMIYKGIFLEILDKLGEMPLPPYIHEKLEDKERYQTVYSKTPGSAAAPTAGLHFTKEILDALKAKGVEELFVTLHVGLGTFRPVSVEDVTKHTMHSEFYTIDKATADALNKAMAEGKRIVSVGTTTTRTLESAYDNGFKETSAWTNIFIYPGYKFKAVGAQFTNFHLPKSTLIMLVSAFAGKDFIMKAYNHAVEEKYRFFSFGDAMLIL